MEMKKIFVVSLVCLLLAVGCNRTPDVGTKPDNTLPPENKGVVTLSGEQVCLPHKPTPDGMHTQECAIGFKDNRGLHYGLHDLRELENAGVKYDPEQPITVSGELFADTSGKYDVVGYIKLQSIANSK